ncbi:hypothetical protein [Paracoccus sp. S3-43]|uniref:hypothetical protein n=1 Tax=Paracoccus sp. S3-43 TaxID=3030011 RepID=UPI0023B1B396|nr:hypothetical protein [Paracoccus sp. S3-43]WEF24636.1 hypothetical protein PXD02_01295 [Paracoccus sp. S3-43]
MVRTKAVEFGHYVGRVEFFTLDETVLQSEDERVFRRDLYAADETQPNGMRLIKRGDLYRYRVNGNTLPLPFHFT